MDINVNKPFPDFSGCEPCGGYHAFNGEVCSVCNLCFAYCVRDVGCKWYNGEMPSPQAQPKQSVEARVEMVSNNSIEEAFESWLASSSNVTINCSVDAAYAELEIYLKKILTPMDKERTYFEVQVDETGEIKFKQLESDKLNKNEDGEYVIVNGRKRTRIGKKVAIL